MSSWWLLGTFFVSHVFLLFLDLITDFMAGFTLLLGDCSLPDVCFALGQATFVSIFLPSLWALITLVFSLLLGRFKKIKPLFAQFVFELPLLNIFKKLQYLMQLYFLDLTCPHNFALISKIRSLVILASINEAFLESVPQLTITIFVLSEQPFRGQSLKPMFQLVTSFVSCFLASINL